MDTSHPFPSVTDFLHSNVNITVTLMDPDFHSDWALMAGSLLVSCVSGKPTAFHPSEAFRHALHCCISVLSALKKWNYMIYLVLLSLSIYRQRSPCGVCYHNKDWFQMSAPKAQNWHWRSREYPGPTANFEANPEPSIPCPALKGKGFLPVIKGKAPSS